MCWHGESWQISNKLPEREEGSPVLPTTRAFYRASKGYETMTSKIGTRKIVTRKIVMALSAGVLALTATACNTVRGVGQDLESVANDVDAAI